MSPHSYWRLTGSIGILGRLLCIVLSRAAAMYLADRSHLRPPEVVTDCAYAQCGTHSRTYAERP
jgi:hypothetical protein